ANALVGWYPGQRARLAFALARLHGRHLAAVCDRLSRDLGRYRRGLPDLFVARAETPGFELLEVKAPGDQLRPEQGAWIDHLNDHDLPAAVLRVRW
ncbi:MAG: VRR-NUC domain-containing protein, partial [Acidobacteriota bacterium]